MCWLRWPRFGVRVSLHASVGCRMDQGTQEQPLSWDSTKTIGEFVRSRLAHTRSRVVSPSFVGTCAVRFRYAYCKLRAPSLFVRCTLLCGYINEDVTPHSPPRPPPPSPPQLSPRFLTQASRINQVGEPAVECRRRARQSACSACNDRDGHLCISAGP